MFRLTSTVSGTAISLAENRSRWLVLVGVAVLVAAGAYLLLRFLPTPAEVVSPEAVRPSLASELARGMSARMTGIGQRLDELARDPELAGLLQSGDAAALRAKEQAFLAQLDHGLRVRLLPPGTRQVDTNSPLHLGYACLEMVEHAAAEIGTPPAEVHLLGSPQQHVDMARQVFHPHRAGPAGVMLVSFDVGLLETLLLDAGSAPGRFDLVQGSLTLASRGKVTDGHATAVPAPVAGTQWEVIYWAETGGARAVWRWLSKWLLPVLASLVGFAGVGLWLRSRALSGRALWPGAADQQADLCTSAHFQGETGMGGENVGAGALVDIPESIFRAYDIRGVVGETLSNEVVSAIGRALGSEAYDRGQQTIVVGRDGRLSGPELTQSLVAGLQASGRDVIDIGMVPTPVLYFATHHLKTGSGVMVTGSHNPPDYNGFKIMLGNETLSGEAIQALRRRIETGDLLTGNGTSKTLDVVDDYVKYVAGDVLLIKQFKVVVDCGNGVAGSVAPRLLRELGCEVTELYCEVDGRFPNHHPDPAKPENLEALIAAVKAEGADLGFAFDGDGDRLGVVDSRGQIIWPDRLMMVYARDLLSRHPGAEIVYDVKCSSNLARVIADAGGKPVMYKTGHSFIKAKLNKSPALLAGEMSGHIFFKERYFGFDDALYAAARLLEALVHLVDRSSTADIFSTLPDAVNTPEINVQMPAEGDNFRFMDRLLETVDFPNGQMTTIDGLRVDFSDGWGLVRASNTTPSLVLRFEAEDAVALSTIQGRFKEQMLKVKSDLELPF